ncbi:hypothetical protein DFP73DRAFT_566383 [Morchella snyderi]|nr:hypothetical protein DFP73DRAFT_566383 [Morchella snyderi]
MSVCIHPTTVCMLFLSLSSLTRLSHSITPRETFVRQLVDCSRCYYSSILRLRFQAGEEGKSTPIANARCASPELIPIMQHLSWL